MAMVSLSRADALDAEGRSPSPINRVRSFLAKRAESLKERRISFSSSARARGMSTSKAATTLQANWRGQLTRRSTMKSKKSAGGRTAGNVSPFAKRNPAARPEEAHQAQMAAFFWGSATPEEQLRQLNRLREELAKTASKPAVAAATAQSTKAPAECSSAHDPLGQSAPTIAPSAARVSSAIALQAGIRGKQARTHKKKAPVKSPPRTSGISLAATLLYVKAGVALAIAAFLVWQLAFTTPRLFDGLVYIASFAALLCATLFGVLQGALPDQTGEEARSATLIQARIRGQKERRQLRLRPKCGKATTSSSKATVSSSKDLASAEPSEACSATLIQARIRGQKERRQSRFRPKSGKATNSSKDLASAVPPQAAASGPRALHGKAAIGAALGAAAAAWLVATVTPRIFSWVAYPVIVTALVCGSIYSWLRLPFWLGYLASELITRLALHGYPLRMRSLRLRPWVELRPLKLHLDLFATGAPRRVKPSLPSPLARGQRTNAIYVQPPTFSVCARLAAQTFTLPTRPAALRRTSCLRTRCTPSLRSS